MLTYPDNFRIKRELNFGNNILQTVKKSTDNLSEQILLAKNLASTIFFEKVTLMVIGSEAYSKLSGYPLSKDKKDNLEHHLIVVGEVPLGNHDIDPAELGSVLIIDVEFDHVFHNKPTQKLQQVGNVSTQVGMFKPSVQHNSNSHSSQILANHTDSSTDHIIKRRSNL